MRSSAAVDDDARRGRLAELARLFGQLGVIAFGGPAAHIAMTYDEVVTRRGWLDEQRFVDLIGVTNLIPGPNSTEVVMHVGRERAGVRGLIVAGASFILPAATIVLVCAMLYVRYGQTPSGQALLYGVKPVVLAIIGQALLKLGRVALRGPLLWAVGVATVVGYLAGVSEILLLALAALVVVAVRHGRSGSGALALAPLLAVDGEQTLSLARLFAVFVKVGAVLYGGGYVLLAFLRNDLVERLGVLTNQQLLDAVAVGQFTPGPVFTTATFVGYVIAGLPGAVIATIGIFLPSFCFVAAIGPLVAHIRSREWTAALLDGVNAAAVGLMAGVLAQLTQGALVDAVTIGLLAAAAIVLWRTALNSAWLIAGGAVAGLVVGGAGAL